MSNFFLRVSFFLFVLFVVGCGSTKIKSSKDLNINFLSEYIVPDNLILDNTLVGGLSGIDYYNGQYFLVCDDSNNPRVYEAKIVIDDNKISNITFEKVILIADRDGTKIYKDGGQTPYTTLNTSTRILFYIHII